MDFEEQVKTGAFENKLPYGERGTPELAAYRHESQNLHKAFMEGLRAFVIVLGVPTQFAAKVAEKAWDDAHSSGHVDVVNCAVDLADLFTP